MKYFTFFSGFFLIALGGTYMWQTISIEEYNGRDGWIFFLFVLIVSATISHFLSLLFSKKIYK